MKKITRYGFAAVFLLFYVYLLMQFSKVFIYYDDFGYLSLSYGGILPDVNGSDFTLSQLFQFMGQHYSHASGRLACLFLYVLLFKLGGLRLVQFFMATTVLAIFLLLFQLIRSGKHTEGWQDTGLAVFLCTLYGLIGILTQRFGTYWFAASFLYVFPAVPFLVFARFYHGTLKTPASAQKICALCILAFFCGFTQEEWLVAVLSLILITGGRRLYLGRRGIGTASRTGGRTNGGRTNGRRTNGGRTAASLLPDAAVFLSALAGGSVILSSPAVRSRMGHDSFFASLSLPEKIVYNTGNIVNGFFANANIRYLLVFLAAMAGLGLWLCLKKAGFTAVNLLFTALSAGLVLFLLYKQVNRIITNNRFEGWMLVLLLVYLVLCLLEVAVFYHSSAGQRQDSYLHTGIFFSAVLGLGALVIVPELPQRIYLPFYLLSFLLLGDLLLELLQQTKRSSAKALVLAAALLASGVPGLTNMRNIYNGYKANYEVLIYNDSVIREYSKRMQAGDTAREIPFYRLPDQLCSGEMVYTLDFGNMVKWMRQYYDLPDDAELVYETLPDGGLAAVKAGQGAASE